MNFPKCLCCKRDLLPGNRTLIPQYHIFDNNLCESCIKVANIVDTARSLINGISISDSRKDLYNLFTRAAQIVSFDPNVIESTKE